MYTDIAVWNSGTLRQYSVSSWMEAIDKKILQKLTGPQIMHVHSQRDMLAIDDINFRYCTCNSITVVVYWSLSY